VHVPGALQIASPCLALPRLGLDVAPTVCFSSGSHRLESSLFFFLLPSSTTNKQKHNANIQSTPSPQVRQTPNASHTYTTTRRCSRLAPSPQSSHIRPPSRDLVDGNNAHSPTSRTRVAHRPTPNAQKMQPRRGPLPRVSVQPHPRDTQ
jgi:hypothetical protein